MRVVQYKILTRILNQIEVPEYIYAFEKGKSIPQMAEKHVGKGLVLSLDLKDFFTSIKQYHLFSLFTHLGFGVPAARTLSELCTYQSFVPQGALTSPKLSNLITSLTFGPAVKQLCDERGYELTIYADDITISMDENLMKTHGEDAVKEIINTIAYEVSKYRFRINTRKTKIMQPYQRQYVCGVVVNRKRNLQKTERNKLRAIVYNCTKNGVEAEAAKNELQAGEFFSKVMGRLNWFSQLNPEVGARLKETMQSLVVEEPGQPNAEAGAVEAFMSADSQNTHQESTQTEIPW
ncbi:reverse transcriptase [compost metagenome]